MARADIPVKDYEALAAQFNPIQFNTERWVRLAKEAGMKYLVMTSEHHDGFCLFDTRATNYNAVEGTPYRRNVLKQVSDACKKEGIRFCVYYSILDWHHPAQELNRSGKDPYENNLIKAGRKQEYVDHMSS